MAQFKCTLALHDSLRGNIVGARMTLTAVYPFRGGVAVRSSLRLKDIEAGDTRLTPVGRAGSAVGGPGSRSRGAGSPNRRAGRIGVQVLERA